MYPTLKWIATRRPVKYICTAGTKNQGESRYAIMANPKVLRQLQAGRYHSSEKVMSELSAETLNDRMRKVPQIRASNPVIWVLRIQPCPAILRNSQRLTTNSTVHTMT